MYDVRSEAWSFGKTVLEMLSSRFHPRAGILLGQFPDSLHDSRFLASIMRSLLENNPAARMTLEHSTQRFDWYFAFWDAICDLRSDNYQKALDAIQPQLTNWCFLPFSSWEGKTKNDLTSFMTKPRLSPDDFLDQNGYCRQCSHCGSYCVICWMVRDGGSGGDYYSEYYYACLGLPGSPCGHSWYDTVYLDERKDWEVKY